MHRNGGRELIRRLVVLGSLDARRILACGTGLAAVLALAWTHPAPAAKRVDFRGSVGSISIKHKLNSGAKRNRKVIRFRWRVVKSPKGASVRLVGSRRARPRLVTKAPGYYRLRLRGVRRSGRKVKRFYRIAVAPQVDPLGLPLETVNDDGRIQLGDDVYGSSNLRLLLVDRNTLEVSASGYPGTREDFAAIGRKITDAGDLKLAIVVGAGPLDIKTQSDADAFNDSVATPIGAAPLSLSDLIGPPGRPFSIVGVSGWKPGAAAVNTGDVWRHDGEPPSKQGSLSGYIQRAPSTGLYGLAFKDYLDFDTRVSGPSGPSDNVMVVGNATHEASLPAGQSGFHIVLVTSGGIPYGGALATNTASAAQDVANLERAESWVSGARLVMIQSIGNPRPTGLTGVAWDRFSRAVEGLGGVRSVLNALDGSSGYAFVGGKSRPDLSVESVNDPASRQTGTLSGLFARAPSGMLRPTIFDPTGRQTGAELPQLAYSSPTAWPYRDTDGNRKALAFIADQIGLRTSDPRFLYPELNRDFGGALFSNLRATTYTADQGFSESEFATIKEQLLKEFRWVGDAVSYFQETRQVLTESVLLRKGELDKVAQEIRDELPRPGEEVPGNMLAAFAAVFGFMRGEVPGAGIISSSMTMAANLTRGRGGLSSIDRLNVTANNLAFELTDRYAQGLDTLGLIRSLIVTDPRKLQVVGTHIANSDPGWNWTDAIESRTRKGLSVAARRTFYGTLLRTSFMTYILPDFGDFQTATSCRVLGAEEPPEAWFVSIEGFENGPSLSPNRRVRAIGLNRENDRYGAMKANGVLTAPLFRPIPADLGPEGLGFYRPTFMGHNLDVDYIDKRNCRQL